MIKFQSEFIADYGIRGLVFKMEFRGSSFNAQAEAIDRVTESKEAEITRSELNIA